MKMNSQWSLKQLYLLLILVINSSKAEDENPPKPEFPDAFQVEVQGILRDEKIEVDGSLYYDRLTNRAALHYKHQNEFSINIYNFNDNQMMLIKDFECKVSEIPETGSFFPYSTDGKNKTLSPAENFFYFTNSVYDKEENSILPSYVFKGNINATEYGLYDCEIFHIFSKPELELPDCDSHTCKPTLISLSLKCPSPVPGEDSFHHSYNFFRFKSKIIEENVFQPPVGIHCKTLSHKTFPDFPPYYSFAYSLIKEQKESDSAEASVYTTYKKVWHDTKLKLIRVDGFDSQGLLQDTRIYDFYGQIAYTIIARIPICQPGLLQEDIALYDLTSLPRIFFRKEPEDKENVVYIGKRKVHNMDFYVWTQLDENKDTQSAVVLEYYFSYNFPDDDETESSYFQISHVDSYAYTKGDITEKYELIGMTYLSISNFRSTQKEWEAFDVSSCYESHQKKNFRLKVGGPPMLKNSYEYEEVLEKLYEGLMVETNISVIRINQLKGKFDGIQLTEFSGWILDKVEIDGTEVNKNEPDMREVLKLIAKAAWIGKFDVTINKDDEKKTYNFTSLINPNIPDDEPPKPKFPDVFQVDVQGMIHSKKRQIDGSVFYDRYNNRAVWSFTFQNATTTKIFDFNKNQLLNIEDVNCYVSEIDNDASNSFFPFSIDEQDKKVVSSPAELFFFSKSKFDGLSESDFPSYAYTSVQDIPSYKLKNCVINHTFSKPEVELPDCDTHSCRPTLMSISVNCPPPSEKQKRVVITYNFYRFRPSIKDVSVFQPPVGIHCNVPSNKTFPDFPAYYSFSYDVVEEQMNSGARTAVRSKQLKIWHDTKLSLVRLDEFDEEGFIEGTRIFDFYGRVAYTITAIMPNCTPTFLKRETPLEIITPLPKIFFAKKPEEKSDAKYIGKRTINGIDYEVWTQIHEDDMTNAKIVEEFYFTENIPEGQNEDKKYLRISHVDKYTYQTNRKTGDDELSVTEYLSINNFKSGPREWEAFDIASCFNGEQKRGFRLKVEGPPLIKNSYIYESVLEKLYLRLIKLSNASLVRISELQGTFDGVYVTEFTGWILNKVQLNESIKINKEPDMNKTYDLIEKAAAEGKLTIEISKDQVYKVTEITDITKKTASCKAGSCTSGGTIAGIAIVTLLVGAIIGVAGYYAFIRNIKGPLDRDRILMQPVN